MPLLQRVALSIRPQVVPRRDRASVIALCGGATGEACCGGREELQLSTTFPQGK
jgi:hypothetical protein